jgi:predicted permease
MFLDDLPREIRHAARSLLRAPAHTASIVILLALGIGANAAMFSLVNALYLRELPVHDPQRLVALAPYWSNPLIDEFRAAQQSFSGILATGSLVGTNVALDTGEQLSGISSGIASGNYFQVLGVHAAVGRTFTDDDDRFADPQPVMVITDGFWRRHFAADPHVLGRRVYLSGSPFTIIGVTEPTFFGDLPGRVRDFWVPMNMQPVANPQGDVRGNRRYNWLSAMGRLKPGVSIQQAQAEAQAVFNRIAQPRNPQNGIRLSSAANGFDGFRRNLETPIQVLSPTVALVLLIVWANVATLLLARGTARLREIAVRQALGCSRARLYRQFFLEGLLLALAGGAIGLALAPGAARALVLMQPAFDPIRLDLSLDHNMLFFGLGISLLTSIAFSLAPALRAGRAAIEPALKSASRSSTGRRQPAVRCAIAFQAALSVMLVAASFLFARSLMRLRAVPVGFEHEHVIAATIDARFAGYREPAAQAALSRRLLDRLSALPGVQSATAGLCAVLMGCSRASAIAVDGRPPQPDDPRAPINPVYPNYFETVRIPLVMGRGFGAGDRPGSPPVAVATEAFARYYFPGENPLGRHFTESATADSIEIIGVVRDMKFVNPRDPPIRMAFLSQVQFPGPFSYVQVRTAGPPERLLNAVRQAILQVDPKLYMRGPDLLSKNRETGLWRDVLLSRASVLFGVIALLLACFGVYGVVSYLVAARTAELGIRLALGALPGDVMRNVMIDALGTVAPGILLGIGGAWASGRLIESLLFGISGRDPWTYAAVAGALLATTILAAFLPALRASRVNPIEALRSE